MSPMWKHFWSWWPYPACLFALAALIGLALVGVTGEWWQLLMRVVVAATVIATAYDRRVRQPRLAHARKDRQAASEISLIGSGHFWRWLGPFALIWLVAISIALLVR